MTSNPAHVDTRDKQVLAGLFLSKFDQSGLKLLGFETFTEAFNVLGYGLGGRPASIKNYRDEFDPMFPNDRLGWRKRKRREYCLKVEERYRDLEIDDFARLIIELSNTASWPPSEDIASSSGQASETSFAKRLITGKAAEQYFINQYHTVPEFVGYEVEDTTNLGCGYDFRLWPSSGKEFKAVEVKGMADSKGGLSLTQKEYYSAQTLADRFLLFVVKNFREVPFHTIHSNPLAGPLNFARRERTVIEVSWTAAA